MNSTTPKSGIKRVYPSDGRWWYAEDLAEINPKTGRPRQKWHKLSKIAEGEAALHTALAALKAKPSAAGDMPKRLEDFKAAHLKTLKSLTVRKEYARMLGIISEAFADFNAAEVLPGDILDFLNENFAQQRTARRAYKARLSTFFSWCVLKDHCKVNPCREVKVANPPKRRGRMTWPIYWALHDHLPETGRLFEELMYLTRQRPTEIRLLRESAILPDRIQFEPTKTEESSAEYVEIIRSSRINKLLARLRELRAERQRGRKVIPLEEKRDPFLLVNEDGRPFTKSGLNSAWRRARDRAGFPKVTSKDMRPFALSQMEQAGHTVEKIREAAAHTNTGQTEEYLNQHRERFSTIVLATPRRPK